MTFTPISKEKCKSVIHFKNTLKNGRRKNL